MQVYVEVSSKHGIPIDEVIRRKFTPPIKLLIMYYNNLFRKQEKEYEKMQKELDKQKGEVNT